MTELIGGKGHTLEIVDFEYGCTRFCSRALQFWTVDLGKPIRIEVIAEQVTDCVLQPEDSLVCLCLYPRVRSSVAGDLE